MWQFNNRELSSAIWLTIFIIWAISKKDVRGHASKIVYSLTRPPLVWILVSLFLYVVLLISVLYFAGLWDTSLLKDTLFWLLGTATMLTFNANNLRSNHDVWKVFIKIFTWTILFEFLTNAYTFRFLAELILVPIVTLLGLMQIFIKYKPEHKETGKVIDKLLLWVGLFLIAFVSYKTIIDFTELFTVENLKSLLLAPVFTLLFMPYVYIIAVTLAYSDLLLTIELFWRNEPVTRKWKQAIKRHAGINLTRIHRIKRKVSKQDLVREKDLTTYLKKLTGD